MPGRGPAPKRAPADFGDGRGREGGATATDFWTVAGVGGHQTLPASTVMTASDLVAAALAGFDAGEIITIPPLKNGEAWTALDGARRDLSAQFGAAAPASRYRVVRSVAA